MIGIALKDNALDIKENNMTLNETTYQNTSLLCTVNKGEIRTKPLRCVGAGNYLEDDSTDQLTQEIRSELAIDGMKVNKISFVPEGLKIDAVYE